jgi:hypothetical protein
MNEEAMLEKIRRLPPDRQEAVEQFIEYLEQRTPVEPRRHDPIGLCADLDKHITAEEIDEARREAVILAANS